MMRRMWISPLLTLQMMNPDHFSFSFIFLFFLCFSAFLLISVTFHVPFLFVFFYVFFIFIFFMFFSPPVNPKHILFSFSPQSFSHHCYSGKNFFPYSFICSIFLLYDSEDTVQAKCRGGVYVFVFCLHFVCKCIILILFVILLLLLHTVLHTPSLSFYNLSAF